MSSEKADWPKSEAEASGTSDRRTNYRQIIGALAYIDYKSDRFSRGKLGAHGTVELKDGTAVDWFLWDGDRPAVQSYAAISGYIAACYRDELYDVTPHQSTYRSFGVSESSVRTNLWLIVRPVVDPDGKSGVYPKPMRRRLQK